MEGELTPSCLLTPASSSVLRHENAHTNMQIFLKVLRSIVYTAFLHEQVRAASQLTATCGLWAIPPAILHDGFGLALPRRQEVSLMGLLPSRARTHWRHTDNSTKNQILHRIHGWPLSPWGNICKRKWQIFVLERHLIFQYILDWLGEQSSEHHLHRCLSASRWAARAKVDIFEAARVSIKWVRETEWGSWSWAKSMKVKVVRTWTSFTSGVG